MAVLFIGAMALIFYILLMRAQHLARMEEGRTDPGARIEQTVAWQVPTVMHASSGDSITTPHVLVFADSVDLNHRNQVGKPVTNSVPLPQAVTL